MEYNTFPFSFHDLLTAKMLKYDILLNNMYFYIFFNFFKIFH